MLVGKGFLSFLMRANLLALANLSGTRGIFSKMYLHCFDSF